MRPRFSVLACLLLLTASSCYVVASVGWDNPLAVYVTCPFEEYEVGSSVTATVHVFKEGAYYDPDMVNLTVGQNEREVVLTKGSVGVYTALITIEQADFDEWDDGMYLFAYVEDGLMGRDTAEGDGYIFIISSGSPVEGFTIDINPGTLLTPTYGPGDTVEVLVEFRFEGTLVDPDADSIDAMLYDQDYDESPLELARTATGVYEGSFAIPAELRSSGSFEVEVSALYTVGPDTYDEYEYYEFYVDFFTLLMHVASNSPTGAVIEMIVIDLENSTLEGANVVLNYSYDDESWETQDKTADAVSGEDGMVTLYLDYSDIDPESGYVEMEGYVELDGLVQTFEYYLELPSDDGGEPEPDPYEAMQVLLLTEQPLPPETTVELQFRAYSFAVPLAGKDVHAYLYGYSSIHFHGTVRTDSGGGFTLSVRTPPASSVYDLEFGMIMSEFQVQLLSEWASYTDYYMVYDTSGLGELNFLLDPGTTLTIEGLRFGGTVEATLDHPDADGIDEQAILFWGIGEPSGWMEGPFTGWQLLNGGGLDLPGFIGYATCTWSSGAYRASFTFPEYLPEDSKAFFLGLIILGDPDDMEMRGAFIKDLVPLPANPAPAALITVPAAGEQYSGVLAITGTASDDTLVEGVEVRVDGATWTAVTGTTEWSFQLDTTTLPSGTHMLEVRAYDGSKHSPVAKVVFEVDQPPTVAITTTAGQRVNGSFSVEGTAGDDNAVDRVEFRVDSGTWDPATGTSAWTAEVNVAGLGSGPHTLEARSSDGERTSTVAQLQFVVDMRPSVAIYSPLNASTMKKGFELKGTAADDVAVTKVEGRLDGGAWTELGGTTSWSWAIPVKGLAEGDHTLEVRSWDGYAYSELSSVTFKYKKPEDSPGATAVLAALALLGAVGAAHLAAQGRRP